MSDVDYDRTATEKALMKAVRRAKLALVKASRIAIKLKAQPQIEEKIEWYQAASKNCDSQLTDLERIVGFKLDPPVNSKVQTQDEDDI